MCHNIYRLPASLSHRSAERLTIGHWHTAKVTRSGRDGKLKIDDQAEVTSMSKGSYTQLTLTLDLFVGGHRNFDEVAKSADMLVPYKGCIQKVRASLWQHAVIGWIC